MLIGIEKDKNDVFYADFLSGERIELSATNYPDAVLEADLLEEQVILEHTV